MTVEETLEWARSQPGYKKAVDRLVKEEGIALDAARHVCDLTILGGTAPGRRALLREARNR